MSRFNSPGGAGRCWRRAGILACLIAACACAASAQGANDAQNAQAGGSQRDAAPPAPAAPDPESGAGSESPLPPAAKREAAAPRGQLRCWQSGHLVYEGRGYAALPPSKSAAELQSQSGGAKVQIIDLYQALCVLEASK